MPPSKKIATKIGNYMLALAHIERLTVRITRGSLDTSAKDIADDSPEEPGDNIILSFDNSYKKLGLNLTKYTKDELDKLKEIIDLAFDLAEPIVLGRDRVAEEAAQNGEDIFYRRHRSAPSFSVFQRTIREYLQGVPNRPKDVLGGDGSGDGAERAEPGRPGGGSSGVVDLSTASAGTEDNGPTVDLDEEPRVRVQDGYPF